MLREVYGTFKNNSNKKLNQAKIGKNSPENKIVNKKDLYKNFHKKEITIEVGHYFHNNPFINYKTYNNITKKSLEKEKPKLINPRHFRKNSRNLTTNENHSSFFKYNNNNTLFNNSSSMNCNVTSTTDTNRLRNSKLNNKNTTENEKVNEKSYINQRLEQKKKNFQTFSSVPKNTKKFNKNLFIHPLIKNSYNISYVNKNKNSIYTESLSFALNTKTNDEKKYKINYNKNKVNKFCQSDLLEKSLRNSLNIKSKSKKRIPSNLKKQMNKNINIINNNLCRTFNKKTSKEIAKTPNRVENMKKILDEIMKPMCLENLKKNRNSIELSKSISHLENNINLLDIELTEIEKNKKIIKNNSFKTFTTYIGENYKSKNNKNNINGIIKDTKNLIFNIKNIKNETNIINNNIDIYINESKEIKEKINEKEKQIDDIKNDLKKVRTMIVLICQRTVILKEKIKDLNSQDEKLNKSVLNLLNKYKIN